MDAQIVSDGRSVVLDCRPPPEESVWAASLSLVR
jgi:hypothetical protein